MAAANLTSARLKELVHYDPVTGVFSRTGHAQQVGKRRSARSKLGPMIRKPTAAGYITYSVDCHAYTAHRLAWLYVNGAWPQGMIDHINGDKADNRIDNLRPSDASLNQQNLRAAKAGNIVGLLGVTAEGERYCAAIMHNRVRIHLGRFSTAVEAHAAYLGAKRAIHRAGTI